jgi:hypothetical protein
MDRGEGGLVIGKTCPEKALIVGKASQRAKNKAAPGLRGRLLTTN